MPAMPRQVSLLRDLKTVRFRVLSDMKTVDTKKGEQAFTGRGVARTEAGLLLSCRPYQKDTPPT